MAIFKSILSPAYQRASSTATLLLAILLLAATVTYAQEVEEDSVVTPFRKGRWLTGLSGSISSSGTTELDTAGGNDFNNAFGLEISTGKFFKDRWLVGVIFQAERSSSQQFLVRESESLFVGPVLSYYFSKSEHGSIFFTISPGYVRFREETRIDQSGTITQELVDGQGIGSLYSVGYSYVIHDRVALDFGFNVTSFWIDADRESQPSGERGGENFNLNNISFSFGFNVLLDSFSF